jgi:hypothetical protein
VSLRAISRRRAEPRPISKTVEKPVFGFFLPVRRHVTRMELGVEIAAFSFRTESEDQE